MAKIQLNNIESLTNEQSALASIALNKTEIEDTSDTFLSRDGTAPNTMLADLDMNSFTILNLPAAVSGDDPVRFSDMETYVATNGTPGPPGPTGSGTGDVLGPATNTNGNIPVWNGNNSKVLADGLTPPAGSLVGTTATQTLTNKTLTTPIIASISNSGTVTIPTGTNTLVGQATTDTLTNKRITARVTSNTSSTTPTPSATNDDMYILTALSGNATFQVPSGSPTQGQKLIIRIKDNGTSRTLTWNAIYRAGDIALPAATTISKTMYLGFIYNSTDTKWDLVAYVDNI